MVDGEEQLPSFGDFPALDEGLATATDSRVPVSGMHAGGHACTIMLSFGTVDFVPQLRNFLHSVAAVGVLHGTVIVGLSPGVCEGLAPEVAMGVVCVQHPNAVPAGDFGSAQFTRLSHVKTEVAAAVLSKGYSLLVVDSDTVFRTNPFPYLQSDDGVDLVIQVRGAVACKACHHVFLRRQHAVVGGVPARVMPLLSLVSAIPFLLPIAG